MIRARLNVNKITGRLKKAVEYVYPTLENIEITPSMEEQTFNHVNSYGYDEIKVKAIQTEAIEITPSKQEQKFTGLYENVNVKAVTSDVDSNIVAENIKENVEILGVKGKFVGAKYRPKYISFYSYSGTNLDYELANLDTSLITDMSSMFSFVKKAKTLNLSNLNTSNVTNFNAMFSQCYELERLDLRSFNTSNATIMSSMFSSCNKLTELDVSSFDTSKVTDFSSMFSAEGFTRLDLSNFVLDSATDISYMFNNAENLEYLDIRNMEFTSKIKSYSKFLYYTPNTCEIIVKDDTAKAWLATRFKSYTNVKTVAELGE